MANYKRITNTQPDVPDSRDWIYQPALTRLSDFIDPVVHTRRNILDQKSEGACTGFAVAAAINMLNQRAQRDITVSPRMLYEMAKRNDEWPGEEYDGSSLRGAIHGWKNMGVCEERYWPYRVGSNKGELTIAAAKNARKQTIGAYYRLKPVISDFHAALNEAGVIAVSAKVHRGWNAPSNGQIVYDDRPSGGHAFIIVGYNNKGFWIQNSWGKGWGDNGVALWSYEDWVENVMDAWVFRQALPTPQIFGRKTLSSRLASDTSEKTEKSSVPRANIAGHFIHVDDGKYKTSGRYWSTAEDIEQTAKLVANTAKYKHILIYAHGGLNSPKASASRIAAMKETYKANAIYPFHIMYDTGLVEEIKDLILRKETDATERTGGFSDWTDRFVEGLLRRPGTLLWDEMKRDAEEALSHNGAGADALERFIKHIKQSKRRVKLHLVGHSTGAVVIAHLLRTLSRRNITFSTCSLLAPACSIDLYDKSYLPVLQKKSKLTLGDMAIYNLKDQLEQDDTVSKIYRKSLLYLVSNAFEREKQRPLLGMEKFKGSVTTANSLPKIIYSNGSEGQRTRSTSHGGFDNDPFTMNHILKRVLGANPKHPFSPDDLNY
ncbi:MAG: alpha/beta hydrolase [Desulfobulbaceae bacterium]|nr:alpha/beta hydrolase [Desulfobulbaceae bacterium]